MLIKRIFEAHCSQKQWKKCRDKAPWWRGTLWRVKHPTKLSVPVSNFDEKHAPTYPHAFMHEWMNAWERAEAAQNIQRWFILICLALVQILHQLWNFSHLNQQGTRNGANSRSNSQKDQQKKSWSARNTSYLSMGQPDFCLETCHNSSSLQSSKS